MLSLYFVHLTCTRCQWQEDVLKHDSSLSSPAFPPILSHPSLFSPLPTSSLLLSFLPHYLPHLFLPSLPLLSLLLQHFPSLFRSSLAFPSPVQLESLGGWFDFTHSTQCRQKLFSKCMLIYSCSIRYCSAEQSVCVGVYAIILIECVVVGSKTLFVHF